ncbi:MAG: MFS transporter [Paracoccaceae bacterium]
MTRDERRGVWLLAIGQTLGFATLTFMFGGILVALEKGTGWSRAELSLGPSLGLLMQALLATMSGRLVDRGYGGALLGGAAALSAACLVALSQVQGLWAWYLLWCVIGAAQAASLYETCFAFLTRRLGLEARAAIIRITLVAGFASTISFTIGASAGEVFGWRGALLVFAAFQLFITLPANLAGVRLLRRGERRGAAAPPARAGAVRAAVRNPVFWMLTGIFGLTMGTHMMLVSFALPVLMDRGASHALAVVVASTVGPMQVAGRLAMMLGGPRIRSGAAARAITLVMAAASLSLLLASGQLWLLLLYAVCQGASIGISSILRPLLTAEALGLENFGAISGALAIAPLGASALAPFAGALLIGAGGVTLLLSVTLCLTLAAFGSALWLRSRGI